MAKVKGYNTHFGYGVAGQVITFVDFANVVDVTPPSMEADDIETTNMDSPDQWKEYEAGFKDAGEAELTLQYAKAAHTTTLGLLAVDKAFCITFSDGAKMTWDGYIKSIGLEIEREGIVTCSIQVKVSG